MKRIESACLVQTLIFDALDEVEVFKKQLEKKRIPYRLENIERLENGMISVQMRRRYIQYPVGQYLEER